MLEIIILYLNLNIFFIILVSFIFDRRIYPFLRKSILILRKIFIKFFTYSSEVINFTQEVFEVCWKFDQTRRPSFQQILDALRRQEKPVCNSFLSHLYTYNFQHSVIDNFSNLDHLFLR